MLDNLSVDLETMQRISVLTFWTQGHHVISACLFGLQSSNLVASLVLVRWAVLNLRKESAFSEAAMPVFLSAVSEPDASKKSPYTNSPSDLHANVGAIVTRVPSILVSCLRDPLQCHMIPTFNWFILCLFAAMSMLPRKDSCGVH